MHNRSDRLRNVQTHTVLLVPRDKFLKERWHYEPGEHVTFLTPTGNGKTTLAMQLLERTCTAKLQGVVLVAKPRDTTMDKFRRTSGFKQVRTWPPLRPPSFISERPPGYVLWPRHTFDVDQDDAHLTQEFRRALVDSYRKGDRIVYGDELLALDDLGLRKEMRALWTRARSMGTGFWGGSQKPTHVPTWAYSQASHLFLGYDNDNRSRQRFSEIGGVDPDIVRATIIQLPPFHFLYLCPRERTMCVVGA